MNNYTHFNSRGMRMSGSTLVPTPHIDLSESKMLLIIGIAFILPLLYITLTVDLLNKSLKDFRRDIIVIAAYMEKAITSDILSILNCPSGL
jgi:hypothetical protein